MIRISSTLIVSNGQTKMSANTGGLPRPSAQVNDWGVKKLGVAKFHRNIRHVTRKRLAKTSAGEDRRKESWQKSSQFAP